MFDFLENPTFSFILHEGICIMGIIYYLRPMIIRLTEKKNGVKKFTTSWESLKNVVAVYIVIAESAFLYQDYITKGMINITLAIITQVLAIIVIVAAYFVLHDKNHKRERRKF